MYLGTTIQTTDNTDGTTCWTMSSEKYIKAVVENVELKFYPKSSIGCHCIATTL